MTTNWRWQTNAPPLLGISTAIRIRFYNAEHITHDCRSRATLDAIRCRHWASICPISPPADVMVIKFGSKNQVEALWNSCFEASVQKARNGPSIQLIEATSCVERSNASIQAKELSYLSSHQMLTADKQLRRYHACTKLVKILTVMTVNSC